ncbi:TPA: N-acetylmuramoyl-L-alanine amidase [bacterium]|nr:N-acetylmuramoyl-L-alanine amidase [bacterium]
MKTSIFCILFTFLFLIFTFYTFAQDSSLLVYDAKDNEIGELIIKDFNGYQYASLEDISKIFGWARKNEPLFGRMTIIVLDKRIAVTKELSRVKVNDQEESMSKPAVIISGKLSVPLDFLTKVVSKAIDKRIVLNPNDEYIQITEEPFSSNTSYIRSSKRTIFRVMIDPGHGGNDIGAKSKSGLREKDLTLEIAKKLEELFSQNENIEVFLTRNDDRYISLEERVIFANNLRGNFFLSIHFGASTSENSKGFNICINNPKMQSDTSESGMFYGKSKRFASEIKAKISRIITNGRDREASFAITDGLFMPAVLVEVLHLTNSNDVDILSKPNFINSVASALSESILAISQIKTESF